MDTPETNATLYVNYTQTNKQTKKSSFLKAFVSLAKLSEIVSWGWGQVCVGVAEGEQSRCEVVAWGGSAHSRDREPDFWAVSRRAIMNLKQSQSASLAFSAVLVRCCWAPWLQVDVWVHLGLKFQLAANKFAEWMDSWPILYRSDGTQMFILKIL